MVYHVGNDGVDPHDYIGLEDVKVDPVPSGNLPITMAARRVTLCSHFEETVKKGVKRRRYLTGWFER